MKSADNNLPEIIRAAAETALGIVALMVIAISILAYFFFKHADEKVRIGIFIILVGGVGAFSWAVLSKSKEDIYRATPLEKNSPIPDVANEDTQPSKAAYDQVPQHDNEDTPPEKPMNDQTQLKLLEEVFDKLKGESWKAQEKKASVLYDDMTLGRCEKETQQSTTLQVESLDQELAQIKGRQSIGMSIAAKFTDVASPTFDSPELKLQRAGFCNERIFGDKQRNLGEMATEGLFSLGASNSKGASLNDSSYSTEITVTTCNGSMCSPKLFGKQKSGKLELISDSAVRWTGLILTR